jgi:CRISPR-associated protein Csy2
MTWLVVKHIDVQGANANSGMFAIGYPAITAFTGFANGVLRSLATSVNVDIPSLEGIAIVHHRGHSRLYGQYGDKMTERRYLFDRSDGPSKEEHWFSPPSELQPQCDLTFSIAMAVTLDAATRSRIIEYPALQDTLVGPRCLGGVVAGHRGMSWTETLADALEAMPSGFVIVDETARLAPADPNDTRDALDILLDHLCSPWKTEGDRRIRRFLLPTQIGFRAVSPLTRRPGARDPNTDHAFAEPVIGLAEWRRKFDVINDNNLLAQAHWRPSIDRTRGLFTIRGA